MTDPERTDLDIRVDAEDRAGTMPDPAEGADITPTDPTGPPAATPPSRPAVDRVTTPDTPTSSGAYARPPSRPAVVSEASTPSIPAEWPA